MRFHRVREVIEWAVQTHSQLASEYRALAKGCNDERLRMALLYLADHEHAMQGGLARYLADDSTHLNVLDTWFDDPADFPHLHVVDSLRGGVSGTSIDDLLATALTIHKTLEDLYRQRAATAPIDDERDLFASLAAGHQAEVRRLVRDMARLDAM